MGLTKMVVSLSLVVILFLSFYSSTAQPISSGTQADNNLIDTENGSQPIKDDTVRVDPLDHLRKYRGGYEIRDMHYWSSTVYTGVPGYALGVLWLLCGILYALYLLVNKFCFKSYDRRKLRKRSLYTRQYYLWPVLLAIFFTILAIIGCGIVLGGDVKFHSRAKTVVDIIIDTADEASVTIFKTTDAMKFMSRNLDSAFGATDEAARFLNSTSVRLDSTATDIEREARKNRHLIDLGLKIVYIVTISIISLTLAAAIALLVFGILKLRRALYVFIVICWLLGVFCWLFFGLYFFIEKFAADTCTAFESFQRDPYNNTLSSILPCDELVSTQSVLKDVSAGVYNLVNQVTRALQGSLWEELQRRGDPQNAREFDVSEIETLFSAVVAKPNRDGKSDERKSASKTDTVHLIEHRRAYNTEIMLTKIKMPLPDMTAAALAMDESILDADQVENLIKFSPAKEEIELLKGYTGDKEKLGKCEQFFMELMRVPRVESKLRVFLFKIQYSSQVSDFRKSLNAVIVACEEVRNSYKLKEIMSKILFVGNTLNQGTARGSAVGFKLDSLLKLTDTRATNNKMTLMHYLCKVFSDKLPHLLDFHEDLVSLEAASKIQLKCLAEEMQSINKGLEKVRQELVASENDGPVSEVFVKTLKEFIGAAESEVTSVQNLYSVAGRNADSLAQYFNEEAARCPFEQVTTILLNFVRMFRKAHDENCKQDELKKKRKQKEVEMDRQRELI